MRTDNTRTTISAATDRNGTTTLPEQETGACRPACAAAHRRTDWARRLSVCKAHGGYASEAGPSCCTFETATSVLALPYDQAPDQCHPAPSRARRRGNGCGNGSAPPSGRLRLGVSSPSTSTFAPRLSAADRPSSPSWTHLRPSRPSSGPGRPWSSLVFVWSSEFGLRRDKFCGFT